MMDPLATWRSADGAANALALRETYQAAFDAIGESDRIGHLLLFRASKAAPIDGLEGIVGISLLRRAVTMFAGMRTLLEHANVDPAKPLARAFFELWLHFRCLAYGDANPLFLQTPTRAADREVRARYYFVAAERRGLRSRASILAPNAAYPPSSEASRDALERELLDEIARLRHEFPTEWQFFGDVTETKVLKHIGGRLEPSWFSSAFPGVKVNSVGDLCAAYDYKFEYDVLYDVWSSAVHPRGIKQDATIAEGRLEVHHPHDPSWFGLLTYYIHTWHAMLLMTAAKWFAPEMIEQLQILDQRHRAGIDAIRPSTPPQLLT